MRLIDCFSDALVIVVEYIEIIRNGENPDYDTVSISIHRSLSEHARDYVSGGYSEDQYETGKFAVTAFIDEALLSSPWQYKRQWKNSLLQMQFFNTVNAGQEFYERLNKLNPVSPAERDIREVYYYCLSLGFRGKYYQPDDQAKLDEIKTNNLKLLTSGDGIIEDMKDVQLFPGACPPLQKGSKLIRHRDYRPLYYGIPIILFFILFFLFKSQIADAAKTLVTAI